MIIQDNNFIPVLEVESQMQKGSMSSKAKAENVNDEENFEIDSILNDHYRKTSQTVLEPSY